MSETPPFIAALLAAEALKEELRGPAGPQGPQGERGPKGDVGIVWRGEWRADTVYSPGDVVQRAGSTWIATSHSFGEEPGIVSTWDLMAARGKPGKVGEKGDRGEKGERGERGPRGVPGAGGGTVDVLPDVIDGGSA